MATKVECYGVIYLARVISHSALTNGLQKVSNVMELILAMLNGYGRAQDFLNMFLAASQLEPLIQRVSVMVH